MRVRLLLAVGGLALLAACTPAEPTHDVAYFKAHADERTAQLGRCRNDPGGLGQTPNCVNANRADGEVTSEKAWSTPKPASRVQKPGQL
ncbi:MAG TPA: EexN family lipoprotein [Caulobacteraceae bacterium]|nr:EexN family lipoprotein [Caulobacteraceae bacterium]